MNTTVDNMSNDIMKILNTYNQLVDDKVEKSVASVAKIAKSEVRLTSPTKTGRYGNSWRIKSDKSPRFSGAVIHAGDRQYGLTHLLEHGHALRNGGRTRAFPHIGPTQEHAEANFLKELTREIENG